MRVSKDRLKKYKEVLKFEIPRRTRSQARWDSSSDNGSRSVLTYPTKEQLTNNHNLRGSVTITESDLLRLEPGEFMNDSLVDFYLRYF